MQIQKTINVKTKHGTQGQLKLMLGTDEGGHSVLSEMSQPELERMMGEFLQLIATYWSRGGQPT